MPKNCKFGVPYTTKWNPTRNTSDEPETSLHADASDFNIMFNAVFEDTMMHYWTKDNNYLLSTSRMSTLTVLTGAVSSRFTLPWSRCSRLIASTIGWVCFTPSLTHFWKSAWHKLSADASNITDTSPTVGQTRYLAVSHDIINTRSKPSSKKPLAITGVSSKDYWLVIYSHNQLRQSPEHSHADKLITLSRQQLVQICQKY